MASLFLDRYLTRDEDIILEKAFWEKIFGSEDVLHVYSFLKTHLQTVTNVKDYVTLDLVVDDAADYRYEYGDTMIAQSKQDLKKNNIQDQGKDDQIDTL